MDHYYCDPRNTFSDPTGMNDYYKINSKTTTNSAGMHRFPAQIKVIPTTACIRIFSDNETDYSASDFITLCGNMMKGSSVIGEVNKTHFILS